MGLHVGKNFLESFPERTYSAKLIVKLNEAKRLGEKTGSGFYQYDAKRRAKPDPSLAPIIEASRRVSFAPLLHPPQQCKPWRLNLQSKLPK